MRVHRIVADTTRHGGGPVDLISDYRYTLVLGNSAVPGNSAVSLTDLELCLPYAVFAQALAMLRSLSLGLSPDNPNAAGTVNRVGQGVTIYPYGATR